MPFTSADRDRCGVPSGPDFNADGATAACYSREQIRILTKDLTMKTALRSALFALALTAAVPAFADEAADRALFQMRYDELHQATDARDQKTMEAIFAPEFVSVDLKDAKSPRDKLIAAIMASPKDLTRKGGTKVISVAVEGDAATVVQRYDMTSQQPDAAGKEHKVEVKAQSTDSWTKRDGNWLLVQTRTDLLDMVIDGQPFVHKERPKAQ
jgi:hypothetical protein